MPTTNWTPTPRQADALSVPDEVFEVLYGGAAGGGKTDFLASIPFAKTDKNNKPLYTNPRFKMLFLRRTYPELEKEVIHRTKGYGNIPPYEAFDFNPYQAKEKRWVNKSGAIIQFGHCENEKDVRRYDTDEYNIIAFDEVTSFTPFQYEYLSFSRCRSSSSDLAAYVRAGTNPGNIGHSYFRKRFVEPVRTGNTILKETRTIRGSVQTILRIFIPSKVQDNSFLMKADPDYVNRLNRLPEAERAAKADGDWWTFSGQVFEDFRTEPFPDEPHNARHVLTQNEVFRIPDYWPKVLAIDWGYSASTVAGWYAINPMPSSRFPAKIYKYREYVCKKTKISTWASDLRRLSQGETLTDVVLDPSAWDDRGDPATIQEQFTREFGRKPRKAHNSRIGGKMLLQEALRWRPRPPRAIPQEGFDQEIADRIRRQAGPRAYEEYCSLFQPEVEEGFLPQLMFFPDCKETINTLPIIVYDKDKVEDAAEFDGDDPYDETRYGIAACQLYLDGGLAEAQAEAERNEVCSRHEQGNLSTTGFYIQMGNLEARQAKESRGIRRFHKIRGVYRNY